MGSVFSNYMFTAEHTFQLWLPTYKGLHTFWVGHLPSNTSATNTAQILQLTNDSFEGKKTKKAVFSCLSKFAASTFVLLVLMVRSTEKLWSGSKIFVQD